MLTLPIKKQTRQPSGVFRYFCSRYKYAYALLKQNDIIIIQITKVLDFMYVTFHFECRNVFRKE